MRPRMFVTGEARDKLRGLSELRASVQQGQAKQLFEELQAEVELDIASEPLTPHMMVSGRIEQQARQGNRDYTICDAAGQRVLRAALMSLITGEVRYRDEALRQLKALFDPAVWPRWRDMTKAHERYEADLRTGMLTRDTAMAYDWLYLALTEEQRQWVLEGIDRCGIQPYLASVRAGAWWLDCENNWLTVVVGGCGIAGMALGEDHPDSAQLVELSVGRMRDYLKLYGPRGEFNESIGYANSSAVVVQYFMALFYHTGGEDATLSGGILAATCRWYMYFALSPGRYACFGDGSPMARSQPWYYTAVAQASQDPQLQWFYLNHLGKSAQRNLTLELLWFEPSLQAKNPEGVYPLGDAFPVHGGGISSRTAWDMRSTACIVYGKAGHGEEKHGQHDAGQLCIDGYNERLIVDLGVPMYPEHYFTADRYKYYNASVAGHNVLQIGERDTRTGIQYKAELLEAQFDDARGGWWKLDLTALYEGAVRVARTVIHLHPGHVLVLDEAELHAEDSVTLRWHTAYAAIPEEDGSFLVKSGSVELAARILDLAGGSAQFAQKHHAYAAPYDQDRLGNALPQKHEPYVEAVTRTRQVRYLTLFSVFPPGMQADRWQSTSDGWSISTLEGRVHVSIDDHAVSIESTAQGIGWQVPMNS